MVVDTRSPVSGDQFYAWAPHDDGKVLALCRITTTRAHEVLHPKTRQWQRDRSFEVDVLDGAMAYDAITLAQALEVAVALGLPTELVR